MDIEIDGNTLCFGLVALKDFKSEYDFLCSTLNNITLSSEMSSVVLLEEARQKLRKYNDTFSDLISKTQNVMKILEKNDDEARLLFSMLESGSLDGDGTLNTVPIFDQTDYKNVSYSAGTVSSSGCGVTALAMLATYITGELHTPAELAKLGNKIEGHELNNVGRMLTAADKIGLGYTEATTKDVYQALKEGKTAIVLVNGSTHFVAVTGLTEDGKWIVRDPFGPTYRNLSQKSKLKNGYAMNVSGSGYPIGELNISNGRAWIFDSNAKSGKVKLETEIEVPKFLFEDSDGLFKV